MATSLELSFSTKLDCGKCDDVLLELYDPTKIAANTGQTDPTKIYHFIPATITAYSCSGSNLFEYTVSYDETLLVGSTPLTECDIKKVCCAGCILKYVQELLANLPEA